MRCYTRRIGWDSPNHLGSGKWTYTSHAPTSCVTGPVLPINTVKPTAFTVGCESVRRSVSSPGTTGSVFWRRATPVSRARSGFAATAIRCSLREPIFGTRATMDCGGLEKSVRERPTMGSTWSDFWTIRGRLNSLFPRRGTQPRRGPYEVLGVYRFMPLARSLKGSNVM